jgi:hypothetical protein
MKYPKYHNPYSKITGVELKEGETIEIKVKRITEEKTPITDTAPIIYTNRANGVIAGYNIRTDRFDIALSAMDKVNKAKIATRDGRNKTEESDSNKEIESNTDTQAGETNVA